MNKIIFLALYCAPLFAMEGRDRFYVEAQRRGAFEVGVFVGLLVSKMLITEIGGDVLTLADIPAAVAGSAAVGDLVLNYPVADDAAVLGRDAFQELREIDNIREFFAHGFALSTIGLPLLKYGERTYFSGSDVPTTGEGLSVFAGASALFYNFLLFKR